MGLPRMETPTGSGEGVVCKFFQRGDCKFGAKCRSIHPADPSLSGGGGYGLGVPGFGSNGTPGGFGGGFGGASSGGFAGASQSPPVSFVDPRTSGVSRGSRNPTYETQQDQQNAYLYAGAGAFGNPSQGLTGGYDSSQYSAYAPTQGLASQYYAGTGGY